MAHATIRDVAREAAVSVASVSRVLNDHAHVRPALRERVQSAAARLGYVPHAGARNLSLARANAIGVVLPDVHGEYFSEVLRGMDREASARGLQLLLSNMHSDPRLAAEALRTMRGRVDGMIVMAPQIDADLLAAHLPPTLPAVLINCLGDGHGRPEIRVDNAAGARAMVAHLVASGRRRIVHLSGPDGNVEARDREGGYRAAMAAAGLPAAVIAGDFSESSGTAAVATLLARHRDADALFAANDMMAVGALLALRERGIAVPDAIALCGFDDIPLARLVSPGLTTMRVGIAEVGERAVERLAGAVAGDDDCGIEARVPALVERGSTAGARDGQG